MRGRLRGTAGRCRTILRISGDVCRLAEDLLQAQVDAGHARCVQAGAAAADGGGNVTADADEILHLARGVGAAVRAAQAAAVVVDRMIVDRQPPAVRHGMMHEHGVLAL